MSSVSIEKTSKKYRGKYALDYETKRRKQMRWDAENAAVEEMMRELAPKSVLDVPVGTGRFLDLYEKMGIRVTGIDVSDDMLALARKKKSAKRAELVNGNAGNIARYSDFDVVVCVRFLDLIDETAMREVVTEICTAARRGVILTIRLGDRYVPKTNTAEHDEKKFRALVRRLGYRIAREVPVFNAGWRVIKLEKSR